MRASKLALLGEHLGGTSMRSLLICSGFVLGSALLMAQSTRGTITGTVSDPAGAVVAGAPVQAKSTTTGTVYTAATSGTGNFTIAELPAGTYDISVEAP